MPIKSKSTLDDLISIEDVIGTPSRADTAAGPAGGMVKKTTPVKRGQGKEDVTTVSSAPPPVIQTSQTAAVSQAAPASAVVSSTSSSSTATAPKPYNFIPGLVTANRSNNSGSYPPSGGGAGPNGSDRYSNTPTKAVSGFLDVMSEGHGFLRPKFVPGEGDIYISQSQIRKFQLRPGDEVAGQARLPKENERYLGLLKVEKVNGMLAEESLKRPRFEDLTPIYPNKQIVLEIDKFPLSTRVIDLLSPIGFGQRGLIVSPPKAGKTTILKDIAHGISVNYPKAHLMAVLIGERPEEVTDISRSVKGEVIASNFDEAPEEQTKVAEVALDRAKRLLEKKIDVIILLDSITRLARAYNLSVNPSGRTLSGGFDPAALYPAKRFLGAARNCEEGGSLTILGTTLVDTGSRMDDLIYEEFKGTGNMELHLSRSLQEQRIFPAIDMEKSGTRHEELLVDTDTLKKIVTLRHMLSLLGEGQERAMTLIERLSKTKSNKEFIEKLNKG